MSQTINEMFRRIIALNEIGNADPLSFSDPDGVRSGKSGWSFGAVQWDTQNNHRAIDCLVECGFSATEIQGIVHQSIDVTPLAARLKAHADIVARYDDQQLQHCLDAAGQFLENYGIAVADSSALLSLADTVNQFGSLGNGAAAYCRQVGHPIAATDVLLMKLQWKYGQEHPHDCERRAANINRVIAEVA